jgi:membrane protein YdbS with pleckstrin-like domain
MMDAAATVQTAATGIAAMQPGATQASAMAIRLPVTLQPHGNLLRYYLLSSLLMGPLFLVGAVAYYFRYRTLRYELDREGITMRWGILFRREISLTYARIQDIQLSSNVVERWLGLARIQLQTASGSASAEMTIEGIREFEELRDFLYSRMRGVGGAGESAAAALPGGSDAAGLDAAGLHRAGLNAADVHMAELAAALHGATAELRALRVELQSRGGRGGSHESRVGRGGSHD